MGRKRRTIEQVAKEMKVELPKQKCFKVADIREFEKQVIRGEISYSRMVEIMNEMAENFYKHKK